MPLMEAIILAGGLGTRLRSAVPDLPKCMALVAGKPFIHYVVQHLKQQGVTHFIFALGYKHEYFYHYLNSHLQPHEFSICIENEPMGTGGAIALAAKYAKQPQVLVTNGDTLFAIQAAALAQQHNHKQAQVTLSLKPCTNFDRYGVVEINEQGQVMMFKEKQWYASGLINGGVYMIDVNHFRQQTAHLSKFSFEKDYLEPMAQTGKNLYAIIQDEYFIDIGIPEDFEKANRDLA